MKTILVWILFSMSPHPQQVSDFQFATQADCIRAGTKLNQYGKHHIQYRCESLKIIQQPYPQLDTTSSNNNLDQMKAAQQVEERNAQYDQNKLNSIIKGTPHDHQSH